MAIAWLNSDVITGSASPLVTPGKNHPAGSLIVVCVVGDSNLSNVTSITNTATDTFHQATGALNQDLAGPGFTDIWYAFNSKGNAADRVTVNGTGSLSTIEVECYTGAATVADPFEVAVKGTQTPAASSVTSNNISPAASGNVNVAVVSSSVGGHTYVQGTNYILRQTSANNHADEDRVGAPSGNQTASMSISSGTDTFSMSLATFKAPATSSSHLLSILGVGT